MRVLVIGGTGYLGHRVVQAALNHGHQAAAICRGITNRFAVPPEATQLSVDRNDAGQVGRLAKEHAFDAILDVVPYSGQHVRIVAEAFGDRVARYVCCSSMAVYGVASYYPTDESHPRNPLPPWAGKAEAEEAAFEYGESDGVGVTVLRPPYIVGEGAALIDVWGGLRPGFVQRIIDGKPIAVPDNGLKLFQMGYVEDVAEAFILALETEVSAGEAYNVGLPRAITYDRYLEILGTILEREPVVAHVPAAYLAAIYGPDEQKMNLASFDNYWVRHVCCDVSKAMRDLGFEPKVDTEGGLRRTVKWMAETGLIKTSTGDLEMKQS